MIHMVILYLDRDEDHPMAGVIVHLVSVNRTSPKNILAKFKKDFTRACAVDCGLNNHCTSCNKDYYNHEQFCSQCGKALTKVDKVDPALVIRQLEAFFDGTVSDISDEFLELMREDGWEFWPLTYRADKIVSVCGVLDFFEDEEDWYSEWGYSEMWHEEREL
jgi:hypothetical protein